VNHCILRSLEVHPRNGRCGLWAKADLRGLIQRLVEAVWRAEKVGITGLETMDDQTIVRGLIELLKKGCWGRKSVDVE
jgi:hypothetical protein